MVLRKINSINKFRNFQRITIIIMGLVCFFSNFCLNSQNTNNEFSKLDAVNIIRNHYLNNPFIELKIAKIPLEKGIIVKEAYNEENKPNRQLVCREKSWLFVADFHPRASFHQKIEIGIVNLLNKDNPQIIEALWWPKIINKDGSFKFFPLDSDLWKKIDTQTSCEMVIKNLDTLCLNTTFDIIKNLKFLQYSLCDSCECITKSISIGNIEPNIKIIGEPPESIKLWAILICGVAEDSQKRVFSFDTNDMLSTLLKYKVNPDRIFYFTPNPYEELDRSINRYTPITLDSIKKCLEHIGAKIDTNDNLFLFISTHGVLENIGNEIQSKEATINAKFLNEYLNKIKCNSQIIVLNACYSGKLRNDLFSLADNSISRIVITSSDSLSLSDLDTTEETRQKYKLYDPNPTDRGSEFMSGFIEAFSILQNDTDHRISIQEAFDHAKENACCAENSITKASRLSFSYTPIIECIGKIEPKDVYLFWD